MLKHIFQIVSLLTKIVNILTKILDAMPASAGQLPGEVMEPPTTSAAPKPFSDPQGGRYSLAEVMPQKAAYRYLGISESKMKLMRKAKEFTVLRKEGDEQLVMPQVWLLRTEVEAKRIAYSIPKGRV